MATECPNLATCGFFQKHQQTKDLVCKGLVQMYCTGDKQEACKRKLHRKETGEAPPDDMLPSGRLTT